MFWKFIGLSAATITTLAFIPQVYKMYKTKSAKDISRLTLVQLALGVNLWIAYGIHLKDPIIILANAVTLFILLIALFLCVLYK